MTARRLVLAWSWGALAGLAVGWVYGTSTRAVLDFRALRRAEPGPGAPQPPSGHSETPEGGNGAQIGDFTSNVVARRLETGLLGALDRTVVDLGLFVRAVEPCPQYSPGGGIPCSVTGPHTAHIFLGTHARDRKDDADERIE